MTCIGNSGPLPEPISDAVEAGDLVACSVLSGQPQLRGPDQPARQGELPRQPAAGGCLRAGRDDGHQHHGSPSRSRRIGTSWQSRSTCATSGPRSRRSADTIAACVGPEGSSSRSTATWRTATPSGTTIPVKGGELFDFDEASTYIQEPPFFTNLTTAPAAKAPIAGCPGAGDGRRQRHDRPHQPRRRHQEGRPGRQVPDRARRGRAGLQQLRLPPRQRPRDDPRHLRQHPPEATCSPPAPRAASPRTCPPARRCPSTTPA